MSINLLLCSSATFPMTEKIGELYSRSYSDGKIHFPMPMELDWPRFVPVDMREAGMKGACQFTSPKSRSTAKSNKFLIFVSLSLLKELAKGYVLRGKVTRAGMLQFTCPKTETARIQVNLARCIAGTSTRQYLKVTGDRVIEGWMRCPAEGGG